MMPYNTYDELPLWSAPFGLMLLDTIRLKEGMKVLDVGSGSGFPMLEVAERLGDGELVFGIDPDNAVISMIQEKIRAKEIRNARIIRGIAEDLPFEDDHFNLIISNNGLNNIQDQPQALTECYRVAMPEAQMVLTMNLPHTMYEFYEIFEETLTEIGMEQEIRKMHDHISQKRKPVEYLKQLILNTGFNINSIQMDGFKLRYLSGSAFLNHSLIRIGFKESWKSILPASRADDIFRIIEEKLNIISHKQGELELSVPFVCFDCAKPD